MPIVYPTRQCVPSGDDEKECLVKVMYRHISANVDPETRRICSNLKVCSCK